MENSLKSNSHKTTHPHATAKPNSIRTSGQLLGLLIKVDSIIESHNWLVSTSNKKVNSETKDAAPHKNNRHACKSTYN